MNVFEKPYFEFAILKLVLKHLNYSVIFKKNLNCEFESLVFQALINNIQAELDSLRDTSTHQKKRVVEMMSSLLKDLGDIGAIVGGSAAENKVRSHMIRN